MQASSYPNQRFGRTLGDTYTGDVRQLKSWALTLSAIDS